MPSPESLTVVWFLCIVLLLVPQQKVVAADEPLTPILIDSSSTILGSNPATPFDTLAVVAHSSTDSSTYPTVLIFSPQSSDAGLALADESPSTNGDVSASPPSPSLTDWIDAMAALPAVATSFDDLASPLLPDLDLGPDWGPDTFGSGMGIVALPEPTRGLLLAVGLISLCNVRRRHPSHSLTKITLP